MIEIINMKNEKPQHPWDFRIDRTTPVGNQFTMKSGLTRKEVCEKYHAWFHLGLKYLWAKRDDIAWMSTAHKEFNEYLSKMIAAYRQYGKLRLFCWCAPEQCHGETIKAWLESGKE